MLHDVTEQTEGGLGNVVVVAISVVGVSDAEEWRASAT